MEPLVVSVIKAGSLLGLGRTTVYDLINNKTLDTIMVGKRRLVTVESIRRLVKAGSGD